MRSAFQNISSELGGVVAVADVKAELKQLKEGENIFCAFFHKSTKTLSMISLPDLQARHGNPDSAMMSQERVESTKVELLRELQGEIDKRKRYGT